MFKVFVALDRSGSMSGTPWANAISALNNYIANLQKKEVDGEVTVIAFDADSSVRLTPIIENKSIAYFRELSVDVLRPEGMTPLYDACANVMDRALASGAKRFAVIILTDGAENASREFNNTSIKAKVEQVKAKGGEVVFLGANFDVTSYTLGAGLDMTKMYNFNIQSRSATAMMVVALSNSTVAYAKGGEAINLAASNWAISCRSRE